jgi:ABC-type amino acid transport substrate-binding protein
MGGLGKSARLQSANLKFRWVWLFIVVCCLALVGCKKKQDPFLSRVQEAGVLRVGLDPSWPPFEYVDGVSGEVVGFDVDLARAIGREMGVEVSFVVSGWEGLYGALYAGQFDAIVSALPYDPWRTREALYSLSYFDAGPVIVAHTSASALKQPKDLSGRTVHVEYGAEGDVQARRLQKKWGDLEIETHETAQAALQAAAEQPDSAAIVDAVSARLYIRGLMGEGAARAGIQIVGESLYDESYVVAVHPRAKSLQEAVDQALIRLRESGELETLLDRWL